MIVLVETLKDYSPKHTIYYHTVRPKIRKSYDIKSNARGIVHRRIENSGRTKQIRGFPIKHYCVSTKELIVLDFST